MALTALRSIINATLLTIATFITITAATADEAPQRQADGAQKPATEATEQSPVEAESKQLPGGRQPKSLPQLRVLRGTSPDGEQVANAMAIVVAASNEGEQFWVFDRFSRKVTRETTWATDDEKQIQLVERPSDGKDTFPWERYWPGWSQWRQGTESPDVAPSLALGLSRPVAGDTLFAPRIHHSGRITWQSIAVTAVNVKVERSYDAIQTASSPNPSQPMLFDEEGRLSAVLCPVSHGSGLAVVPNPHPSAGRPHLAYLSVLDMGHIFEAHGLRLSDEFKSARRPRNSSPLAGEWRLHSWDLSAFKGDEIEENKTVATAILKEKCFIRDGVMYSVDTKTEFQVEPVNNFTWKVVGPDVDENDHIRFRQLGSILRFETTDSDGLQVLNFRAVNPKRTQLVEQITDISQQLSTARTDNDSRKAQELATKLSEANAQLNRLDQLPEMDLLQLDALIARERGDHAEAASLEQQAKALASQMTAEVNPSDLDSLQQTSVQEGESTPTTTAKGPASTLPLTTNALSQAKLAAERKTADDSYADAERTSLQAARDYRAEATQESPDPKALAELKRKLDDAVAAAFEAQMKLQQLRLQIAQQNLAEVQAKHQQRQILADRIIERRVADLMSGENLDWQAKPQSQPQDSGTGLTRANGEAQADDDSDAKPPRWVGLNEADASDASLDGEWRLEKITGRSVTGHETGLTLKTSEGRWTLLRGTHESNYGRRVDPNADPATVDMVRLDQPDAPPIWSGIYKVEGDTLTAAWAPSDGSAPRPTDYSGSVGTVQVWKRVQPLPTFASPQELVNYIGGALDDDSVTLRRYVSVLTDEEAERFAGVMIRTISGMQAVTGLVAAFGAEGQNGEITGQEFVAVIAELSRILQSHELGNPPPQAQTARQQIQMSADLVGLLSNTIVQKARMDVDDYSKLLRTAAGTLDDPRSFLLDVAPAMTGLETSTSKKATPKWEISEDGNKAVVVNTAHVDGQSGLVDQSETITLIKVDGTWKISSMLSDDTINKLQEGMKSSRSSSPSQAATSQPAVSSPAAPTLYPSVPEPNSIVAKHDLKPFTELTAATTDARVAPVIVGTLDSAPATPEEAQGKYINRPMKQGELITVDMLIDKPTTEQIVDFWMEEAVAGRGVFESMKSLQHQYRRTFLYAMEFPFSASYAKRFNDKLPDWTPDYLQAATKRLQHGAPVDWSQQQLSILPSLGELIHYQTVNEKHDLATIGELLTMFVSSDFSLIDVDLTATGEKRKAAYSSWLLGELVRLTGRLPEKVLEAKPLDDAVVTKLQLLETMTQNSADDRWISQERRRLFGLAEEAPVQALKLLLTSKPITSQGLLESWIFALSSEETYSAWRSSPSEHFSPPLDPVVAIAVAELLAGKDEATDNNLALLFQQQHPGYMFARHVDDLLSSELAYRDSVLQLLVSIYSKSKSPALKSNIAKMAPSVPVQAGQGQTTSTLNSTAPGVDMQAEFLLYFHAAYCAPCQKMTPLIRQLANSKTIPVHMIDVTENPKPTAQLNVDRIPTIVVMRQGQVVGRKTGVMTEAELSSFVKSPNVVADTEHTTLNTVAIKGASNNAAVSGMSATARRENPLESWLKDIRAIGTDAATKRDSALNEVEAALNSDDVAQNIAATAALAQTSDVMYEKGKYRERILELCRSSNRDLVKSALYALYNTDHKPEDLALAQEVLSKPEAAWAGHSISHLLMMFGDGEISGKSEDIILSLLNSSDHSVRREALRGLWGAKTSDKLMDRVIELVDVSESHHDAIYFALSTSPDKNEAVVDKLIETLSDPDWNNWGRAIWGLGYGVRDAQQHKVAEAMLQMYENRSDPKTRGKCEKLIQQYGSEDQLRQLTELTSASKETQN